jgi:L-cysteine desulfidase
MPSNELLIEILKDQVKPALGCTEPGAVAYAVARAKELLGTEVEKLSIRVDKNILKNGMDVGIPGTSERGIVFAAALSLAAGKSEYVLEVLKDVNSDSIEKAHDITNSGMIELDLDKDADGLYISVEAKGGKDRTRVVIRDAHTNIVFESRNDEVLLDKGSCSSGGDSAPKKSEVKYRIKEFSIDDLVGFVDGVPIEDIAFIRDGMDMNMRIAEIGVSENSSLGIGRYFHGRERDVFSKAKAYTAAASEARMSGYPLPVMSSAGSGNHGLVAIIPISVIGAETGIPEERIIRSVALSHLITIYVKVYTGALSPVCGCGVAAGVGCAAGLTYMMGGGSEKVKAAVNNMAAGISGMICDGAKLGCSYKLSIAVDAAVDASDMALKGIVIPSNNGILGRTAERTIQNLGRVSGEGMNNTDNVILDVMLHRCV